MKRLISWLLALTLICGLLPMSVFAVQIETDGDSDLEVDFGELNPINLATVVTEPGATFEVTLEAGKSAYYTGTAQFAGMVATINGEKEVVLSTDDHNMVNLVITNDTDATETYTVEVNYPAGFWQNPVIIESMKVVDNSGYSHVAKVPAGQDKTGDYYYYKYIAEGDGTIDLSAFAYSVVYGDTEEDVTYVYYTIDILVNGDLYSEPVVVTAGEEITIQLIVVEDDQGNAFPGCDEVNFNATFNYYAGHESNPIDPWNWTTSAEVTVPAGKTLYYTAWDGMTLTVSGEVVEHNGVFSITNDGAEDATYALEMIYPEGHTQNPVAIEDEDFSKTGITVDDDNYYNYTWTAPEDGTLTLSVTENANISVLVNKGVDEEGWPINDEYFLAEADIVYAADGWTIETITWNVAENLAIEVAEGDVLKIQVTGIDPNSDMIVGGVNYTLTGAFQAAEPEVPEIPAEATISFNGFGGSLQDLIKLYFNFKVTSTQNIEEVGALIWTSDLYAADDDKTITSESATKYVSELKNGAFRVETDGILAQNLDNAYYIIAYVKTEYGYVYFRPLENVSMATYATVTFAGKDENLKSLMVDLFNYANAARNYFCLAEGLPAPAQPINHVLTEAQKVVPWNDSLRASYPTYDSAAPSSFNPIGGFKGFVVNLGEAISIKHEFTLTTPIASGYYWTQEAYDANDVLNADNKTDFADVYDTTTRRVVRVPGIYAFNIYDNYYVRACDAEGNMSRSLGSSVAACLTAQLDGLKSKTDAESLALAALCQAMLVYGNNARSNPAITH